MADKTPKYRIPNDPLTPDAFNTPGGFELWTLVVELYGRVGALEQSVKLGGGIGGAILLLMVAAIMARVFEVI
jgi:hypothetical protein